MYKRIAFFCNSNDAQLLVGKLIEEKFKVEIIKQAKEITEIKDITSIDLFVAQITSNAAKEIDNITLLRKNTGCINIPLVVISAHTDREVIMKSVAAGAKEFITRPDDHAFIINKLYMTMGIEDKKISSDHYEENDFILISFNEIYNREIKAASRGDYPVSVALLYPVMTKSCEVVNEADFLNTLRTVIKKNLRDTDWTFIHKDVIGIILPFSDYNGCEIVLDRIKNIYKNHAVLKPNNTYSELQAVSVTFPHDGRVSHKLLEKLNEALISNLEKTD